MKPLTSYGPAELAHGPMFIGFLVNATLLGSMVLQSYLYFITDKTWIKTFVVSLIILDTLNTIFDFAYLYQSLIIHFDPVLTALIASLVQLFYAWRVKMLTGNMWLTLFVVACSLLGFATTIEVHLTPRFSEFIHFKVRLNLPLSTVISSHKSGLEGSDMLVDRIIRITLQTGLTTAVCAIADLILFLADPVGLHLAFNFPLCKLYTNSLFSSLNARNSQGKWGSESGQSGLVELKRASAPLPPQQFRMSGVFIDVESVTRVSSVSGPLVGEGVAV
ncbi:hypothetical protein C8R45DRAFT_1061879 [Mycena sanguinolenta]|nr:hypothetical protein C8R45DRAFT_1061879 [Mycena sanguinolenta]